MKVKSQDKYFCYNSISYSRIFDLSSHFLRVVILACFCLARYEEQLSASLEREKNLEMMRAQIEPEWRKCCENMKTEHYRVNEQPIKGLMQNKDQVSVKWN